MNDSGSDCSDVTDKNEHKMKTNINIINTNARSLCPKISSLIDCFEELNVMLGVVTEMWLTDGATLDEDLIDLERGSGLGAITLNRKLAVNGVSHGG